MANTLGRKFWVVLTLTAIPVTDFVGADWFYTRHNLVGLTKVALCLLVIGLVYVANIFNQFGAAFFAAGVIFIGIIWWIVDIFLLVLRKRL